ncbi:hypothetical protein TH66_02865 [Carbonactinospora thermoautotrophica]|uniref:Dienelactone hydrolase domain-containing protein n=1 Tax=Carbonactinospora thermoautotrophica TaxID=1469144 RepID=A0A132N5U3_9ACTN|nr:hypothetical protein TH66_02865 [Carbonactinospora thermoautotrophica]
MGDVTLYADLDIPQGATGIVAFAHGSGSGRHSPRNQFVARELRDRGLATLLLDLLTEDEEARDAYSGAWRFNIPLLTARVVGTVDWLARDERTRALPVGLFGASTGAAAALGAAAQRPDRVRAVVSRGGRPDLAASALPDVRAPTLLIVGGDDTLVLGLNEDAAKQLTAPHELRVVPGAGHLFEEPGALELVARYAADWFTEHLRG